MNRRARAYPSHQLGDVEGGGSLNEEHGHQCVRETVENWFACLEDGPSFRIFFQKLITVDEICVYQYDTAANCQRVTRIFISKTQEGSHEQVTHKNMLFFFFLFF